MEQIKKILEDMYLRQIREINLKLKKCNATYNNWETADERIKQRCNNDKEEYKKQFIDWHLRDRSSYIQKLRTVRKGYIYE